MIKGNQKLAMQANVEGRPEVQIETRGEGGYVVAVGSPNGCHASGQSYDLVHGSLTNTPGITTAEQGLILNCCRSYNSYVPPEKYQPQTHCAGPSEGRPGTEYSARADVVALLEKHGWAVEWRVGNETRIRRPGKKHGISAVWHADYRKLYVFSSNATPFEPNQAYRPFAIYAYLEHSGDFRAAARQLKADGYGDKPASNGIVRGASR